MTVRMELDAMEFTNLCWSGARDTCSDLSLDEIQTVLDILEDSTCDREMSLTEVNDVFWFERDTIAEWLGYEDYDDLMSRDDEEEEE